MLRFKRAITFTTLYRLPNPQWGENYPTALLSLAYSVIALLKQRIAVKVE